MKTQKTQSNKNRAKKANKNSRGFDPTPGAYPGAPFTVLGTAALPTRLPRPRPPCRS